jgi:hypothetical protein
MHPSYKKTVNSGSRTAIIALGVSFCLMAFGCSTPPAKKAPSAVSSNADAIQELNLLSMPMALNLDANPGADGIAVKLFANNASSPKTVAIAEGKVEILMYDGVVNADSGDVPPVLHMWAFSPQELKPFLFNKKIGMGYDLVLVWGKDQPQKNRATVIARHVSDRGKTVFSGPVTVTVSSF